jgi:hypothetical protein
MKKHRLTLIVILLLGPLFASANFYTLPIDLSDPQGSYFSYFDHDDNVGTLKRYDGVTSFQYDQHHGIDFATTVTGKNVLAAADGVVHQVGWENPGIQTQGYGFRVYIWHNQYSQSTVYGHMASTTTVSLWQSLTRGQLLGVSSSTGDSTGPHLHFGVYTCDHTATNSACLATNQVDPFGWQVVSSADPWPNYGTNANNYLWTTDSPSSSIASTTSSNVTATTTWRGNIVINGDIQINAGITLTLEQGTVIKFKDTSSRLVVQRVLNSQGTSAKPVYFTAYKDDSVGGDTNGDGASTTATAGDWKDIQVGSTGSTTLAYTVLRYGGNTLSSQANLYNNGGKVALFHATSTNSYNYGIDNNAGTTTCSTSCDFGNQSTSALLYGGSMSITNSRIHDNIYWGVYGSSADTGTLTLTSNTFTHNNTYLPSFYRYGPIYVNFTNGLSFVHSGNTSVGDGLDGIITENSIGSNTTWTTDSIPYIIGDYGFSVDSGKTLTLNSGATVKFASSTSYLTATGTISAVGTSVSPIYFTSIKDDVGNDTNGDGGSTTPASGDWRKIQINSGGSGTFTYSIIRYGGHSSVNLDGGLVNLGGLLTIASSTISTNPYGILHCSFTGTTTLSKSNITGNTWGLVTYQTASTSAKSNWWNGASGPYHAQRNATATGDAIYDYNNKVDFSPWLTSTAW